MQKRQLLTDQLFQILQNVSEKINRKDFCELHGISQSKLSRILSGKVQPDFELLDYMAMYCGFEIELKHTK